MQRKHKFTHGRQRNKTQQTRSEAENYSASPAEYTMTLIDTTKNPTSHRREQPASLPRPRPKQIGLAMVSPWWVGEEYVGVGEIASE
jgi:hypothetical protein